MTGTELLEALSYVDERYIAEAETAALSRNVPWMKVLSVAACLCILITGAFALERMTDQYAESEAAAPAAPAAKLEETDVMEAAPKEEIFEEAAPQPPMAVEEAVPSDELQHVPYAKLRVVKVLEDGSFEAIAEATQEMEADTQVTVVVDPSKVPGAEERIVDTIGVTEGALVEIYDGAYEPSRNILYVAELFF